MSFENALSEWWTLKVVRLLQRWSFVKVTSRELAYKQKDSKMLFDFKNYFVVAAFAFPAVLSFFMEP